MGSGWSRSHKAYWGTWKLHPPAGCSHIKTFPTTSFVWEILLHFLFAFYSSCCCVVLSGRWLLRAWKHKGGTRETSLYYTREKKASSVAAGPLGKINTEDLFPFLHNTEILGRNREGRQHQYIPLPDSERENRETSVSGPSGSWIRWCVHWP